MPDKSKVMTQAKKKGYPGCPGWGLGVEQTTPCKKKKVLFGNLMTKKNDEAKVRFEP